MLWKVLDCPPMLKYITYPDNCCVDEGSIYLPQGGIYVEYRPRFSGRSVSKLIEA
jgi:hypothetical protein